jgi:Amt family ammonium transporter
VLGLLLGFGTYFGSHLLKAKLGVDDALEVTTVHGLSGVIGSLSIGFIASKAVNPNLTHDGLVYGGDAHLLGAQLLGVGVTAVWSTTMTFVILCGIGKCTPLRASAPDEDQGLDIAEHGEVAYHELTIEEVEDELGVMLPNHFGRVATTARRRISSYNRRELEEADEQLIGSDTLAFGGSAIINGAIQ